MNFFRKLFGPGQKEIWEEFAYELGAEFHGRGTWQKARILHYHRNWPVEIDTYTVSTGKSSVVYTRIRALFTKRDDFRFALYRSNFFHGIGKFLGMQDVEVGYELFDKDFTIQGSDPKKLKMLFEHPDIRDLISYQPSIHFELKEPTGKKRYPEDVRELYFQVVGVIKDPDRLYDLIHLFEFTLDHLFEIGTAEES